MSTVIHAGSLVSRIIWKGSFNPAWRWKTVRRISCRVIASCTASLSRSGERGPEICTTHSARYGAPAVLCCCCQTHSCWEESRNPAIMLFVVPVFDSLLDFGYRASLNLFQLTQARFVELFLLCHALLLFDFRQELQQRTQLHFWIRGHLFKHGLIKLGHARDGGCIEKIRVIER